MNQEKWVKLLKAAAIVGSSAAFVTLLEQIDAIQWGKWDALVTAGVSLIVQFVRLLRRP